jgi:U3 small nucleolar RNA-associated protein 18
MAATTTTSKRKLVFDDDGQAREVRALEQLLFGDEGKAAATVLGEQPAAATRSSRQRRPAAGGGGGTKRSKAGSDASALAALVGRAQDADDDELFAVDRPEDEDENDDEEQQQQQDDAAEAATTTKRERRAKAAERARRQQAREQAAAVWHDPDDDALTVDVSGKSGQPGAARLRKLRTSEAQETMTGTEYERALRARHSMLAGSRGSRWASAALAAAAAAREEQEEERVGAVWSDDDEEEEGEGGARSVADLLRRGNSTRARRTPTTPTTPNTQTNLPLPQGTLQVARLRDANASSPSQAVVRSVEWHPNGQLLMTAGMDRAVRLFGVDGRHNPLVQGVHLSDTPVQKAAFAGSDGGMIVAAGRRSYYYVVDLHTGAAERVVAPAAVFAEHGRGRGDAGAAALARASAKARQRGSGAAAKHRAASMAAGAAANAAAGPRLKSLETFAVTPPCGSSGGSGGALSPALLHHQPFLNEPLAAFAGDGGHVALVSLRTRQPLAGSLATLKVAAGGAGAVRCLSFAGADSRQLVAAAGDGLIYVWDLRKAAANAPLAVFRDEGCVAPSSLAASRDGRWLACGSSAGVVNVYRTQPGLGAVPVGGGGDGGFGGSAFGGGAFSPASAPVFGSAVSSPTPARALMNLVTAADTLQFSPDSQALLAASRLKRDALRVFHLPSLSAFGNWPTGQTPLGYVHCAGWSPGGGMLAVGNAKGRALLYRLLHYGRV